MEITASIRKFVADSFLYRENVGDFSDRDSFLDAGLIDSTGILELICFVEKTFGVQVADEEVVPDNFDSVERLSTYVCSKLNGSSSKAGVCHAR